IKAMVSRCGKGWRILTKCCWRTRRAARRSIPAMRNGRRVPFVIQRVLQRNNPLDHDKESTMTNIRHYLIRAVGLLLMAALIQGCTVHWDGKIDNNTNTAITLIGDEKAGASWTVSPHEKINITWKYKCL